MKCFQCTNDAIKDIFRNNGFWCQRHLPSANHEIVMVPRSFWNQTYHILKTPYMEARSLYSTESSLLKFPAIESCEVILDRVITHHSCNYHNIDLEIEHPWEFDKRALAKVTKWT